MKVEARIENPSKKSAALNGSIEGGLHARVLRKNQITSTNRARVAPYERHYESHGEIALRVGLTRLWIIQCCDTEYIIQNYRLTEKKWQETVKGTVFVFFSEKLVFNSIQL